MASLTLYQRLLGPQFDLLPRVLRQFHSRPDGGLAQGSVAVQRGSGFVRHTMATALRLPTAGTLIPLRLQVIPQADGEHWIRHFGDQCLETRQWCERGLLIEKAGPLLFAFKVTATMTSLSFEMVQNRVAFPYSRFGFPLVVPFLRVSALATGDETVGPEEWRIRVEMQMPLLGTLTTYSGEIRPQC
jgi:hypothetical protein